MSRAWRFYMSTVRTQSTEGKVCVRAASKPPAGREDDASVAAGLGPCPSADSPLLMEAQDTGYEVFAGEPSQVPQPRGPGLCWGGKPGAGAVLTPSPPRPTAPRVRLCSFLELGGRPRLTIAVREYRAGVPCSAHPHRTASVRACVSWSRAGMPLCLPHSPLYESRIPCPNSPRPWLRPAEQPVEGGLLTLPVRQPGEQQGGGGQPGRGVGSQAGVQQRQLTQEAAQVLGSRCRGDQRQQDVLVVHHSGDLDGTGR